MSLSVYLSLSPTHIHTQQTLINKQTHTHTQTHKHTYTHTQTHTHTYIYYMCYTKVTIPKCLFVHVFHTVYLSVCSCIPHCVSLCLFMYSTVYLSICSYIPHCVFSVCSCIPLWLITLTLLSFLKQSVVLSNDYYCVYWEIDDDFKSSNIKTWIFGMGNLTMKGSSHFSAENLLTNFTIEIFF